MRGRERRPEAQQGNKDDDLGAVRGRVAGLGVGAAAAAAVARRHNKSLGASCPAKQLERTSPMQSKMGPASLRDREARRCSAQWVGSCGCVGGECILQWEVGDARILADNVLHPARTPGAGAGASADRSAPSHAWHKRPASCSTLLCERKRAACFTAPLR